MLWPQRIALLAVAALLLAVTFELIRKRRLREEYAVLWVCTGLMILAFVILPDALFTVASWLALDHDVLMTFICVVFLAAMLLHYSAVLSKVSEREKGMAQEITLLKEEIEQLREELEAARRSPGASKPKPPALRT